MIYKDQAELDEALAYWQKVLRLQDWRIEARFVNDYDMDQSLGRNHVHWNDKTGLISINQQGRNRLVPNDHEVTMVHELVHIHTRPIVRVLDKSDNDNCDLTEEETCVHMIAEALVALHRKAK